MPRRAVLALLVVACLALSGCTQEEERSFFLHVILFCFGIGAGCASMAGSIIALMRAAQRKPRNFVNFAISIPLSVTTIVLHAVVTEGFDHAVPGFTRDSLWLFAMTATPLFWLAATIIEIAIAPPPSPPAPPGQAPPAPPPVDSAKLVSAVLLPLLVITAYSALLVHVLPPGKSSPPSSPPGTTPMP